MATVTRTNIATQLTGSVEVVEWANLGANDDGEWVLLARPADKSLHVYGTIDGATVGLQGSNESTPTNPAPLRDASHTTIAVTVLPDCRQVMENPLFIRPKITGGTNTQLTVRLVCRY
jgi:hypothetical protein